MKHPQQENLLHVDVKELKGHPGAQQTLSTTVEAPAGFGTVLVGIAEHSELNLDLRAESVHEGVLLTGTASAEVNGQCGRCLDPISYPLTVDVMQLYSWEPPEQSSTAQSGPEEDDEETRHVTEQLSIDAEPVLRDLMVSALPFQPVCRADCPGLCSQCGFRMEEDPSHAHEQLDPRWATLAGLADQLNESDEDGAAASS
ncbi:YceD family protein [Nesterenkonia ebinurensis]|uniref:YceD family protein n=1 Tax=Nesterenkonia ebinurensis TaxID=2608252 RepID=UPI001CC4EB81|nr:YceD family protein [Nesterenkonia ebinurensis]